MSRFVALPLAGLLALALVAPTVTGQISALPPHDASGKARVTWDYYPFTVFDHQPQWRITMTQQSGTQADLFVRRWSQPTGKHWDARSATPGTASEEIVLNLATQPPLASGTWWVGVRRSTTTNYSISMRAETIPSVHAGMGANVFDVSGQTGTAFRVWAPNASNVTVTGTFNAWNSGNAPLADEGNGHWSLDVRNTGAGAEYQYVITGPGGVRWKNDPRARRLTNSAGNSIVVDPDNYAWQTNSYSTPAWNDMIVYELHVGTFSPAGGVVPGDFADVETRLDYLADLGVNVIELMPFSEFAQNISWGYNYSHPFSVESAYGSPNMLKRLIDEAHERGIAVFADVIYNHWGPSDLDLWQFDGWNVGGWGGIYFYNDARAQTPWGDTRPDFGRTEVRQYIRDNVLFWLEEYRFDGLRFDSTSSMRVGPWGDIPEAWSLMQWINDEIDSRMGWKLAVAEDMWSNAAITQGTPAGGAGFDTQWDPNFVHPIQASVTEPNDNNRSMWSVRNAIAYNYNSDAFGRVIYSESHDEVANGKQRVPEMIWPGNADSWYSKKRSTLAGALVMTSPGIPMLFQGQELLEDGHFSDTDPVDWNKLFTFGGIHDLYRDLIRLRRDWFDNTAGLMGQNTVVHHVNDNDKMIAFHRWDQGGPGDDVIVIANFRNRSWTAYDIGLPRDGTWRLRFNSDWDGYDSSFGNHPSGDVTAQSNPYDGMPYRGTFTIAPYTVLIYSQ